MTKKITPLLPIALLLGIALLAGCSDPAHAAAPSASQPQEAGIPEQLPSQEVPSQDTHQEAVDRPEAEVQDTQETEAIRDTHVSHSTSDVLVRRLLMSRSIEDREPVSPDTVFSASSDRLYAFFDVRNSGSEDAEFLVTFEGPGGRSAGHVELSVPADVGRWRTWAYTRNATEPGEWTAEIHDADGNLLASQEFTIE